MSRLRDIAALASVLCVLGATACGGSSTPETSTTTQPSSSLPAAIPPIENPGQDRTLHLEFGGKQRSYVVHTPPSYADSTSLPLVVAMHSFPGDAAQIATTTGLNAKADKENFLVVYPEGYSSAYNALVCCGTEDDVGFIRTVIAEMTAQWKADPRRVYATGMSNGGDMSYKLAVELPGTFAAIAPVSGGFIGAKAADESYKPSTPVSVITFLGGKDRYISQFETGITQWQRRLACTPTGAPASLAQGITLTKAMCGDGSEVHVYRLPEMGHGWAGAEQGVLSEPNAGVDATDLLWEFFQTHPK
ncbi:alpha/beta hydrolase family esterase [Nocardia brasiliensis]|uniref:extracellular catalytic domain type 1 short-chain-length polyhydroxyalkanoate depolymerase n=1 Tax=Nocardia brasiliensis TaxID=37326 RepID=UPI00366F66EA